MIPIARAMLAASRSASPIRSPAPRAGWRATATELVSQFRAAEMIAEKWEISRDDMEAFALESHRRAIRAIDEGRFAREIVALGDVEHDEGPRRDTSLEKMATLQPLEPGGRITAAVSSQISDGAAALLVASERALKQHGLKPRARIHHLSVRGDDPIWMLTAPIPATRHALRKTGHEARPTSTWSRSTRRSPRWCSPGRARPARIPSEVNVNGGAIALGHPLGATGARLMTTLLCELERRGARYGLQTMCEGGGQANVTILERFGASAPMAS